MRSAFAAALVYVVAATTVHAQSTTYGDRIVTPEKLSPQAEAAVADLLEYLPRITGRKFTRSTDRNEPGIILLRLPASEFAVRLEAAFNRDVSGLSTETFCLRPGGDRLWIEAKSDLGLAHGVAAYLEWLGVRWYHASDRWTVVPKRDDIRLTEKVCESPAFRMRVFAGSGGFGPATPRDPKKELQARWEAWQRRNRFGGEFRLAGHSGESFNLKHRAILEAHPEYRALVDGKRADWWLAGKFCISNPEVLKLYVEDRLAVYRQAKKLDPNGPGSWAVSVEPADGGGHCECAECLKLGSVSDRVFYTANVVARAVRKEFPDGHVSLFAYNEHAGVPNIAIEPNVYVAVIPYGFQRTSLAPEQLIDAWGNKASELRGAERPQQLLGFGIYDYWSIPDWSHDAPTFDPLVAGPAKLRSWHDRGVNGFLNETTYSGGAMGPAWWIISRLAWDTSRDVEALFKHFCTDCFGPGAPPMERMLRRWSTGYYPTTHELALSFRDVDEAWRLAEADPASAARIADYGRYVEYLRLLHAYDTAKYRSEERYQAAVVLADYGWSIYDSAMVHAYRHAQLLGRDEAPTHPELRERYDPRKPEAPGWAASQQLTDDEIRTRVTAGVAKFQPESFTVRRYDGKLRPLVAKPNPASTDEYGPILWSSSSLTIDIVIPEGAASPSLRLAIEKPVRVTVLDANGVVVWNEVLVETPGGLQEWRDVPIHAPRPGSYQVRLWSPKRTFCLQMPVNVPHRLDGWYNSQGRPTPRLYFYVPHDVDRVAIYAKYVAAGPPKFYDADGREVKPTFVDGERLILTDVPAEQRGRVWSLDKAKCPIEHLHMLNTPQSFAFAADCVLVPEDSLPKLQPAK